MTIASLPLQEVQGNLADDIQAYYRFAAQQSSLSARAYLDHVVIDSRPEPRAFRLVARPWQWAFADALCPALESVAGVRQDYVGPRSFWLSLPRGHDKTSLIGRLCNWALAFARQRVSAVAAAADREQAGILAEFMEVEADLNPWLKPRLAFRTNRVHGAKASRLKIISADAFSSFGLKADLHVVDELTHWPKRDLWDTLWSGRQKRPDSVYVVISNAGLLKTWQHEVLELAKSSPESWWVYDKPGRFHTWMDEAAIAKERRLLPPGVAARVFDNRWLDPSEGCGFVTRAEAQACENLGVTLGLVRKLTGEYGVEYVAGIDYGPKRDRTVCCVLHRQGDLVVVDQMEVWQGSPENPVPVDRVERWVEYANSAFGGPRFVVDEYQLAGTVQKYRGRGYHIDVFQPRGGKSNYELAANLRSLVVNHSLAWHSGCGAIRLRDGCWHTIVDEFAEVTTRMTPAGFRIDNEVAGTHDDRVVALGMAALWVCREPKRRLVSSLGFWF